MTQYRVVIDDEPEQQPVKRDPGPQVRWRTNPPGFKPWGSQLKTLDHWGGNTFSRRREPKGR